MWTILDTLFSMSNVCCLWLRFVRVVGKIVPPTEQRGTVFPKRCHSYQGYDVNTKQTVLANEELMMMMFESVVFEQWLQKYLCKTNLPARTKAGERKAK